VCLCGLSVNAALTYVCSLVRLDIVCLNESEERPASKKLFVFLIGRDGGVYHYLKFQTLTCCSCQTSCKLCSLVPMPHDLAFSLGVWHPFQMY